MLMEYKFIENDYKKYVLPINIDIKLKKEQIKLENIKNYIKDEVNVYIKILLQENFIIQSNNKLKLSEKGLIASNINEVHSLCFTDIIQKKLLNSLNEYEIVSVLSIFTNIRIPDEIKIHNIKDTNVSDKVQNIIVSINNIYYYHYDIETHNKTSFKENYNINYDLCDIMFNWSKQISSSGCLKLCERAKKKDIFLGEFVKAVIKINNIVLELQKICDINNDLNLLSKLKLIPKLILKSIVTMESLYLKTL